MMSIIAISVLCKNETQSKTTKDGVETRQETMIQGRNETKKRLKSMVHEKKMPYENKGSKTCGTTN